MTTPRRSAKAATPLARPGQPLAQPRLMRELRLSSTSSASRERARLEGPKPDDDTGVRGSCHTTTSKVHVTNGHRALAWGPGILDIPAVPEDTRATARVRSWDV